MSDELPEWAQYDTIQGCITALSAMAFGIMREHDEETTKQERLHIIEGVVECLGSLDKEYP